MNIKLLIDKFVEAIAKNLNLISWCNEIYLKNPTVYKGIDLRKPPPQSSCPLIAIIPSKKSCGESLESSIHTIGFVCMIFDETKPAVTTNDDGTVISQYVGIDNMELFRKCVEDAIMSIDFTDDSDLIGLRADEVRVDYDPIDVFPFYRVFMEIDFRHEYSQGDDTWA